MVWTDPLCRNVGPKGAVAIHEMANGGGELVGDGTVQFTGLAAAGNYIVTPSLSGYSFTPPSQTFNNLIASQTANFIASVVVSNNLALGKAATQSSTAAFGPIMMRAGIFLSLICLRSVMPDDFNTAIIR